MSESSGRHSPHSQSGCDKALLWRLNRGGEGHVGQVSFWFCPWHSLDLTKTKMLIYLRPTDISLLFLLRETERCATLLTDHQNSPFNTSRLHQGSERCLLGAWRFSFVVCLNWTPWLSKSSHTFIFLCGLGLVIGIFLPVLPQIYWEDNEHIDPSLKLTLSSVRYRTGQMSCTSTNCYHKIIYSNVWGPLKLRRSSRSSSNQKR